MTRQRYWMLTAALVGSALAAPARGRAAGLPEDYLKRWDNPAVQKRIDDGIEKHRKSDATLKIVDAAGQPVAGAGVKVSQKSHEFLFGCNIFVLGQMKEKEKAYEEAFVKLFNFATVPFYWAGTEPEQGKLRLAEGSPYFWRRPPPDRAVAFGKKHGLTLKGHPLLWHAHNPNWLPKDPNELKRLYEKRFKEIAERYGKDIRIWDGVNESLVCPPSYPFFSAKDRDYPTYISWAFGEERKVFGPEALLILNDVTQFNWPPNESNRFYRQCRKLLENRVPIEGIGFQFHFFDRKGLDGFAGDERCDPNGLLDNYEMFAKLGLPLWITEITIGSAGDEGPAVQARVVRDIYRLWFSAPKMAGITWWNLGDGTAHGNEGRAGGGLTDEDFNPKPAYQALDRLINQDWMTDVELKSGADGNATFRGFQGRYDIEVTVAGKTKRFEVTVGSDGPVKEVLALP